MELIPAIDLRHGDAVRLRAGVDAERTVYDADLTALLPRWAALGVRRAHVVDLDGAFGEPPQRDLLHRLLAVAGRPQIQLGGGLRDAATIVGCLAKGCERVVVGSFMARHFEAFARLVRQHPRRIVAALDAERGAVRIAGWRESAAATLDELCERLHGLPCAAVLVTDVERDGTLEGPNLELARHVARRSGLPALLSGGVASLADLRRAARADGIAGVVVGRALWDGRFTVAEALAACAVEVSA